MTADISNIPTILHIVLTIPELIRRTRTATEYECFAIVRDGKLWRYDGIDSRGIPGLEEIVIECGDVKFTERYEDLDIGKEWPYGYEES